MFADLFQKGSGFCLQVEKYSAVRSKLIPNCLTVTGEWQGIDVPCSMIQEQSGKTFGCLSVTFYKAERERVCVYF